MNLKSYDVLIVDVTIIVGLLFFISVQSFSSMAVEQTNFDVRATMADINVENIQTKLLIEELCIGNDQNLEDLTFTLNAATDCEKWYNKIYMNNRTLAAIKESVVASHNTTGFEFTKYDKSSRFHLTIGPLLATGVSFSMIIPFVVSAMFISINALFKKEDETIASKYGVVSMIVGFAMLIIGFLLFISIMFCSAALPITCGVEETLRAILQSLYPELWLEL